MHRSSRDKMRAFCDRYLAARRADSLTILDLGSCDVNQSGSYREYFSEPAWTYRGMDLQPGPNVDIVLADPYAWAEIADNAADVLISGQAFEHIAYFWETIREVARVLKPGGLACIIAPSAGPEHRYPVDCWRFYPDGLAALARYAGLEALEIYVQEGETGYPDGSDLWRDAVLVARKPSAGTSGIPSPLTAATCRFNPLDHPIAFLAPRRLTEVDFWHAHIPFAFVLVELLRPRVVVELGTHRGDSYCALCQAVDALGLEARCTAVDTWQGDAHAGAYGEEILAELQAYHDPLYGRFSRLLRTTFEEGRAHFADGSVDLLHIDGYHTYEAVRRDFETWRPKMSARGVVLFHDTQVRDRGFGVWRLWQELAARYPGHEFPFGSGLGVLAVGPAPAAGVLGLLSEAGRRPEAMNGLFEALGTPIRARGLEAHLAEAGRQLAHVSYHAEERLKLLHKADADLRNLQFHADERLRLLTQADGWLKERDARLAALEAETDRLGTLVRAREGLLARVRDSRAYRLGRVADRLLGPLGRGAADPGLPEDPAAGADTYVARIRRRPRAARPRIIHAIGNLWVGGSSQLVVDLIERLGHKYAQEVITQKLPLPRAYCGFAYHDFSDPATAAEIAAFLSHTQADLLHVHYWGEGWYQKVFEAARLAGVPVIENINTPRAPFVQEGIRRYVYVSDYGRSFGNPAAGDQTVIYPGSDLRVFSRAGAPWPDDVLGTVYRLEDDKLREDAMGVFVEVLRRRPGTRAVIVGGGSLLGAYRRQVEAAGLTGRCEFTGYVPYARLPALYRRFSVFVAPVWSESFGQVTPFAMGMALPVAGYRVGALPEILGSEDCLADNPEDLVRILMALLDDRRRRRALGAHNQRRARRLFALKPMIRAYDRLYAAVLSTRGRIQTSSTGEA